MYSLPALLLIHFNQSHNINGNILFMLLVVLHKIVFRLSPWHVLYLYFRSQQIKPIQTVRTQVVHNLIHSHIAFDVPF